MVSINQRLDAEIIELVAEEFGYEAEFINLEQKESEEEDEVDAEEDLLPRAPIVTIMGHVDHGKTSLLDYIRSANVVAGEAGGITQHIGAYQVTTANGKKITFLDTPGHEAFTAMRARGAKAADVAVIVVAADDAIMPQTREAISHAQAASLPMIFAINKIDKPGAQPEKIKEQLANMNLLVEDWGGTYQCQEISAKKGLNIDVLLEKIGLEADMLELKANPDRAASGSVIEASLDKGRGYLTTLLVQNGTLHQGEMIVCGQYFGKVKAMFNERGQRVKTAVPSTPVQVLGLNGAPQAGEKFKMYEDEDQAKEVANHRAQILREQGIRARKHITLDEIGRRLALGNFKELGIIIKGDFDGSVEALSDSLQKLSTPEVAVRVVHKAVGQITESDVLLATASDAIIVGFQVRPSLQAARLAEQENIEIRSYSIIYDAIQEIRSAMEGLLEPKVEKKTVCNVEVRDIFKISGVGTIAGCYVLDGKLTRNTKVNLIRDGIVVYTGELASLKRFKDDAKEVNANYECGLSIRNYNDVRVGDIIEGYEEVEVKRTL
jgi:translation initiation factor IF-2